MAPDRKQQLSWAFYDWANSAFATTVLVGLFPILFNKYYAAGVEPGVSTFYLGAYGNSLPSFLVMLMAPWLGVLADKQGWKKRLLLFFTLLGASATASLMLVGEGQWQLAIALFALGGVGFFGGLGFYDSLLVNVAAPAERDRVSALGYGLGYLGGGLLFVLNVSMVQKPEWFGLANAAEAGKWAFVSVAVWWLLFSWPLFRNVRESRVVHDVGVLGWAAIWATMKQIARYRPVYLFLFAYWLYIDAVNTVANMAVDFGIKLGFEPGALIKALLIVQFVSFPAAIVFGRIGERFGAQRGLYLGLSIYIGVTLWALSMQTETDFYLMAAAVGLVQGGVQSLSRSFYASLIPKESAGQFFGFYNMLGKFAAVLGPLVVGLTASLTGNPRLAIFVLVFFFAAGMLLLARVRPHQA
ncbi:MAG: MFS transporter [Nevskiaceae bacterium]|jgi:UMF1 family MFS transporter|nr:MAG: MFS transporter [Nevskiaceae bacterium]TAM33804.1 MAG: MFS transporter [Nevskiaceae bacterium]